MWPAGGVFIVRAKRLRLTDFSNYRELDLELPRGLVVFSGRNAQGKTNLLEAISLVATSGSFGTTSEREAVRWSAAGRFARGDTLGQRRHDKLHVEGVIAAAPTNCTPAHGHP